MTVGSSTLERPDTREDLSNEGGRSAHIIKQVPGKTAQALVTEARVFGFEVTALCGYRWVPQHKASDYPLCQRCKEIYDGHVDPSQGLPEEA